MPFKIENIVPWGRSLKEYKKFFSLSDNDLNRKILSVGDGPASVNSEMKLLGKTYLSYDPVYQFSKDEIQKRIDETHEIIQQETRENADNFVWKEYKDPDELFQIRLTAMKKFLLDFEKGKSEKRYISGELPVLPFLDNEFDLVLSSHFLFLYTGQFSLEDHLKSIFEILRVGKELRIFPLLDLDAKESAHLKPVINEIEKAGLNYSVEKVNYEFQKGGNKMLKIFNFN